MFTRSTSLFAQVLIWSHWLNRRLWPGGYYVTLMVLVLGGSSPAQAQTGTTVAGGNGSGSAANQLHFPNGVYVDGSGTVFVADQSNHRIQKFSPGSNSASSGTTVAGGNGQGAAANQLHLPSGVFVDGSGTVFVADQRNDRIQQFAPGSTSATAGVTVAGGNGRGSATNQLNAPRGAFVDGSGNVFVADTENHRIQQFAPGSRSASPGTTVAGGNGAGSAANQLNSPQGVFVDGSGNVFVADVGNHRIQRFLPSPVPVATANPNQTATVGVAFSYTTPSPMLTEMP